MTTATYSRTAPAGLLLPDWLVDRALEIEREVGLVDHGLTRSEVGPGWWRAQGIEVGFPGIGAAGEPVLRRGDLFRMGEEVGDDASLLEFCWHVVAWVSGTSRRNNLRRIESCRAHVDVLRDAYERAYGGDRRGAYDAVVRGGRAVVPYFGPAFATWFLYFVGEADRPACLALDARVSQGLSQVGWALSSRVAHGTFSHTWPVDTYVSYCELLESWADRTGPGVFPDMFERALRDIARFPSRGGRAQLSLVRGSVDDDPVEPGGGVADSYVDLVSDLRHVGTAGEEEHRGLHVGRFGKESLLAVDGER